MCLDLTTQVDWMSYCALSQINLNSFQEKYEIRARNEEQTEPAKEKENRWPEKAERRVIEGSSPVSSSLNLFS